MPYQPEYKYHICQLEEADFNDHGVVASGLHEQAGRLLSASAATHGAVAGMLFTRSHLIRPTSAPSPVFQLLYVTDSNIVENDGSMALLDDDASAAYSSGDFGLVVNASTQAVYRTAPAPCLPWGSRLPWSRSRRVALDGIVGKHHMGLDLVPKPPAQPPVDEVGGSGLKHGVFEGKYAMFRVEDVLAVITPRPPIVPSAVLGTGRREARLTRDEVPVLKEALREAERLK